METMQHSEEMLRTALISNHKDVIDLYQKFSPRVKRLLEEAFRPDSTLFKPIVLHSKSDWILSHPEPKQDFYAFYSSPHRKSPVPGRNIIYIQTIGSFGDSQTTTETYIHWLKEYCETFFYGLKIKFLDPVSVSQIGCVFRVNTYSHNLQIRAGSILKYLQKKKPQDAFCIVGITMIDLYPEDSWNFVFGQASLTEGMGVFSFARYDDGFYTTNYKGKLKKKKHLAPDDYSVFDGYYTPPITSKLLLRSCKTLTHEIGHIFGMHHCQWLQCVMQGSNHLEESDRRPIDLCPICLRKLQYTINFDVKERYKAMLTWIEDNSDPEILVRTVQASHKPMEAFKEWKEWLLRCLQFLEK
ncbi:archaemetzincin-2 [Rhincodon typus]|uniref:archaemetzincin-2 n=1 Tax=Rhincodon typus TaxID=259920 RepID=UPI0009A399C2|nr:archaemetzincin-2 [Rhincodon typus]XP_048466641.1 archaemetzincin-2 [Rhincodon typus]XP_048466642.1 archaemetzincin-2 [Rhincodon typus]XP_048466643.1 archaemetzincin-2 [Rhincodon typus]XP_048466644.1 archaemetzincin-2 [Rhincodon typus]